MKKKYYLLGKTVTRLVSIMVLAAVVSVTGGCAKTDKADLMENASPETSALALYKYDGENVTRAFIYDKNVIMDIIGDFNNADVSLVSEEDRKDIEVTVPYYALEMSDKDGFDLNLSWSNGYVYKPDGKVYKFDYDFDELSKDYSWVDEDTFDSLTAFPNNSVMAKSVSTNEWKKDMLTKSKEHNGPEGISISILNIKDNIVTVKLKNQNDSEWTFGTSYSLEVSIDDTWYQVPVSKTNWGFDDIAIMLAAGEEMEQQYDLTMYEELPKGQYRIVIEEMTSEFTITED